MSMEAATFSGGNAFCAISEYSMVTIGSADGNLFGGKGLG
jgi:hypothetical protein